MPPESTPEFVAELEKRGFERIVTVPVTALQPHTYNGQSYDVGATYACDDQDVETVEAQGKARRVAPARAERGAPKTTAVGELRTTDMPTATPKK